METILNFTEDTTLNGFRLTRNLMVVVRVKTEGDNINEIILDKINVDSLANQLKKGKSKKAATATLIWRAVRALIKAQAVEANGIVIPNSVPKFVGRKLGRKLAKRGMSLYTVSDIR